MPHREAVAEEASHTGNRLQPLSFFKRKSGPHCQCLTRLVMFSSLPCSFSSSSSTSSFSSFSFLSLLLLLLPPLKNVITFCLFIYLWCGRRQRVCQHAHMEVRGQPCKRWPSPSPWGLSSGLQAWPHTPLPTEASH